MKKTCFAFLFAAFLSVSGFVLAKHFWRGELMSVGQVCKKWGERAFIKEEFKVGDPSLRLSMACSLLKNKKIFFGMSRSTIRQELGDPDGFYFSDMFPAYMIQIGKSAREDSWQIVFLLDRKQTVNDVVVHKNCCSD